MTHRLSEAAGQDLRVLFESGTSAGRTDSELLERYRAGEGDVANLAFRSLVERHGPMVLRTCRAILRDDHEAQDAFQATFIVLARKSPSLWIRDSLGPWLHRVACRAAIRAKKQAYQRQRLIHRASEFGAARTINSPPYELTELVHRSVNSLPERYRRPIVLHYLEGLPCEDVAQSLGCPVGTVKSLLARGRSQLQHRLKRYGDAPSAEVLLGLLAGLPHDTLPPQLLEATTHLCIRAHPTHPIESLGLSTPENLAKGLLTTMIPQRMIIAAAGLLVLGFAATGIAQFGSPHRAPTAASPPTKEKENREPKSAEPEPLASLAPSAGLKGNLTLNKWDEAILERLEEPATAHFSGEFTFGKFLAFIKERTKSKTMPEGIPIHVSPSTLKDIEKGLESKITLDLDNVPIKSILKHGLEQVSLQFQVDDGVLVLFSQDLEPESPMTRLKNKLERGEASPTDVEQLLALLQTQMQVKKLETELVRLEVEKVKLQSQFGGGMSSGGHP